MSRPRFVAALLCALLVVLAASTAAWATGSVTGTVISPVGTVSGGLVRIVSTPRGPYGPSGPSFVGDVQNGGSYSVEAPSGQYRLSAYAVIDTTPGVQTTMNYSRTTFSVSDGPTSFDVQPRARVVHLSLVDENQQAAHARASISCQDSTGPFGWTYGWSSQAEGDGALDLSGIQAAPDSSQYSCVLRVWPDDTGSPMYRRLDLGADDLSVSVVVPSHQDTLRGSLTWPFGPVTSGSFTVQAADVGADPVATGSIAEDGSWSTPVWPGTYDVTVSVGGSGQHAYQQSRERVVVDQDEVVVEPAITYRAAKIHVVSPDGTYLQGILYADCQQPGINGRPGAALDVQESTPSGATSLIGLISAADTQCVLNGDENIPGQSERFVVPGGSGPYEATWDVSTSRVYAGSPTTSNDADGVPDLVEGGAPNNGDGNGDHVPDVDQANVSSLPALGASRSAGSDYVTVAAPDGAELSAVSTSDPASLSTPPPAGTVLPHGLVSFKLPVPAGATRTVSIYAGSTAGVTGYAKYDPSIHVWSTLPSDRVAVFDDHVDVTLTDGGPGDADKTADGVITDPGGMAKLPSDVTPPIVTGQPTTQPNSAGWYHSDVTVHWSASDPSGVAAQPTDTVLTGEGANLTASSGQVCDQASPANCTTGSLSGINIDRTAPTLTIDGVSNDATYVVGAAPTPRCSASDSLSGLAGPCTTRTTGGNANGVGSYTTTAQVQDKAGNSRTVSTSYRVVYKFDGFKQPVNDSSVTPGIATSTFKAGSTVPLQFSLRDAKGRIVYPRSLPVWLTPVRGARSTAAVNEAANSGAGSSGTNYWPLSTSVWGYSWSTKGVTGGYLYTVGVRLDDGTTHTVVLGLR